MVDKRTYGKMKCKICGKEFIKTSPRNKFCEEHRGYQVKGFPIKKCLECGTEFKSTGTRQEYCKKCSYNRLLKQNKETLRKLRLKNGATPLGSEKICIDCGKTFIYKKGMNNRCDECVYKNAKKTMDKWFKKHPNKLKQYLETARDNYDFDGNRIKALERDNFKCQLCGSSERLHMHHIDGKGLNLDRKMRNNDINNLITLCNGCHTSLHNSKSNELNKEVEQCQALHFRI